LAHISIGRTLVIEKILFIAKSTTESRLNADGVKPSAYGYTDSSRWRIAVGLAGVGVAKMTVGACKPVGLFVIFV
jgi:hypothetical protein